MFLRRLRVNLDAHDHAAASSCMLLPVPCDDVRRSSLDPLGADQTTPRSSRATWPSPTTRYSTMHRCPRLSAVVRSRFVRALLV